MAYTWDDFCSDVFMEYPPEIRVEIMKRTSTEERIKGIPPEEILKRIPPEVIQNYLENLSQHQQEK